MYGRLFYGSPGEGQAADYGTGLEHWAGIGTWVDAGVVGCRAQAIVVVVVEG